MDSTLFFGRFKIWVVTIIAVGLLAAVSLLGVLSPFELDASEKIAIDFDDEGVSLSGTLLLPKGEAPFPVVLFLHGDGPQDRFAGESYTLVMNRLLRRGIACFAWDKPGVGASGGNWLDQSMADRADEAIAALTALKGRSDIATDRMGFIGFSQAGWVIPHIAARTDLPACYIVVGGAINWRAQGRYLTRTRLAREGYTTDAIAQVLAYSDTLNTAIAGGLSYDNYVAYHRQNQPPKGYVDGLMDKQRYEFVRRNIGTDVATDIAWINKPLLALWGSEDLNVDPVASHAAYQKVFATKNHPAVTLKIYQGATHGLLKANRYNTQRLDQWSFGTWARYLLEGEDAYIPGYLDFLADWVYQTLSPR